MPEVHLWSGLRALAEGQASVRVEGDTVARLLANLEAAYPALGPAIEAGVSVSVNGRIIATGFTEPVPPDAEIYLLQRLRGG